MKYYVALVALIIFLRNSLCASTVLSIYSTYPFKLNSNFIRCTSAYASSNGRKPLYRLLFANLLRAQIPQIIGMITFKGKIICYDFMFANFCIIGYTTFFHYCVPMHVFRKFRYVWGWLIVEYYAKHASDWIDNRNKLDVLSQHNFIAFWLFAYIEYHSTFSAMFDSMLFGEMSFWDLPEMIWDGGSVYIIAIPLTYMLQKAVFGSNIQLRLPLTLDGLWWQKWHVTGWKAVDMVSTEYDHDWLYCVLITFIFIAVNAPQNVYPKLQRLDNYKDPAKATIIETVQQSE